MIEHEYPENIQHFLDQLLCDIRIRQTSVEHFYKMYSDDLYYYVKIVAHSCDNLDQNNVVKTLLLKIKSENFLRFVILTTHFKTYQHLLN